MRALRPLVLLVLGIVVAPGLASAQRRDPNLGRLDRFPDFVSEGEVLSPWNPSPREQRAMRALRRRARAIAACVSRRDGHPAFALEGAPPQVEAPYPDEAQCLTEALATVRGLPTGRFRMILNFHGESPVGVYARELRTTPAPGSPRPPPRYACDITASSVPSTVRRSATRTYLPDFESMRRHAVLRHHRDSVAQQACRGIDTMRVLDPWGGQISDADREWSARVQAVASALVSCVPAAERPSSWSLPFGVRLSSASPEVLPQAEASERTAACVSAAIGELRSPDELEGTLHINFGESPARVYFDAE